MHECIEVFKTEKVDQCSGEGFNKCHGVSPMILEIYFVDQDGLESCFDNWQEIVVNFCPFCGLKSQSEKLNKEYASIQL